MAKTILLADDSLTIQKVVELTFMDQDYRVISVGDGKSALMRWSEAPIDLVIADVHMPGLEGYDVCRQVKAQRPDTPVLLLVGTFEPFDEERATASGADGHLKKPFDSQELLRLVDRLLSAVAPSAIPNPPVIETASEVAPEPLVSPSVPAASAGATSVDTLSDADIDRIARRVVELVAEQSLREIAWEVVPDLAEVVIKERIRELEAQVE